MPKKMIATPPAMPSSSGRETEDWSAVFDVAVGVGVGSAACGSGPNGLLCALAAVGAARAATTIRSRTKQRIAAARLDDQWTVAPVSAQRPEAKRAPQVTRRPTMNVHSAAQTPTIPQPAGSASNASGIAT